MQKATSPSPFIICRLGIKSEWHGQVRIAYDHHYKCECEKVYFWLSSAVQLLLSVHPLQTRGMSSGGGGGGEKLAPGTLCLVCDDVASGYHYSIPSCNGLVDY